MGTVSTVNYHFHTDDIVNIDCLVVSDENEYKKYCISFGNNDEIGPVSLFVDTRQLKKLSSMMNDIKNNIVYEENNGIVDGKYSFMARYNGEK